MSLNLHEWTIKAGIGTRCRTIARPLSDAALSDRDGEREGAAATLFAVDGQTAAVRFDDSLCDGETKSGAWFACPGRRMPIAIENALMKRGIDAAAGIGHRESHGAFCRIGGDGYRPTVGRELDGVP